MTKEQVRLKAEEISNGLIAGWYITVDNVDYFSKEDIIKAMLEFGLYIEELTKQRCVNNAEVEHYSEDAWLNSDSILNIPNLCLNET